MIRPICNGCGQPMVYNERLSERNLDDDAFVTDFIYSCENCNVSVTIKDHDMRRKFKKEKGSVIAWVFCGIMMYMAYHAIDMYIDSKEAKAFPVQKLLKV